MKRLGWLILLISIGLNLGFTLHLWRKDRGHFDSHTHTSHRWSEQHDRHWPARGDTAEWRRMGHRRMDRVSSRLGLDPGQAEVFRRTHEQTVHRLADERSRVQASRRDLRELLAAATIDSVAVRQSLHELGRRQATLDSLVTESFMREMSQLDPEQRARYLRMMPFGPDRGSGGQHRRGRGPGHD